MTGVRPIPRWWSVLLVAAAVVLAAEGVVRFGESRLSEPRDWYSGLAESGIVEAERLSYHGIESDLLFAGTSMVYRGVLVERVESRMPSIEQARNVALDAGQTPVMRRWLLEEMVPRLHPRLVVWGVSSLDFNGNRPVPTIDRYEAARATRPGWVGACDRFLGRILTLSHYRSSLRAPGTVALLLDSDGPDAPRNDPMRPPQRPDHLLTPVNQTEGSGGRTPREAERIRSRVLADWVYGDGESAAFRSTVRALLDQGIGVVVVVMPVPTGYIDLHPDGATDYQEFLAAVQADAAGLRVPLLDFSAALHDEAFYDYTHLNRLGAEEFTASLAEQLTALGW